MTHSDSLLSSPYWTTFLEALDYRMCIVRKRFQHFHGHVVSNVCKFINRLQSQLEKTYFDEADAISILAFLKEFRDERDSIGVHERVVMWLLPHLVKKPATSSL